MALTIITNNVPRDIIESWEISEEERKDFDYIDWSKVDRGEDSVSFFRYKGELYDLGDFMRIPETLDFEGWDGYISDTFFSGILVKYTDDFESVVAGRFYS